MSARNFEFVVREDATHTLVGRLTWRSGSGAYTGVRGEGKWATQANVSSLAYAVYDLGTDEVPITATLVTSGTWTVSSVLVDTPVTPSTTPSSDALWKLDQVGYNLSADLSATAFPTGGNNYVVRVTATFSDGSVGIDSLRCLATAHSA